MLDVHDKRCKPSSWIWQPLPRMYLSTFVKSDKGLPGEGWLFALRYVKALAYFCCLHHRYSTAAITVCSCLSSSLLLLSLPPLFHCRHHFLSPWMHCASRMSFGMIVTRFAWIAQSLLSSKRPTRYASKASWRARRAMLCIRISDFKSVAISLTRCWKGAFLIKRSVFFWYLWILRVATVPGR